MHRRLLAFVLLLTATAFVAGCGDAGFDRASAQTDAASLLRSTAANLRDMRSATVDLKLRVEPRGENAPDGPMTAQLTGPFEAQEEGELPKFAFATTLQGHDRTLKAGATWTGSQGFVGLQGAQYAVPGLVVRQFAAGYEEALKSRAGSGGLVLGTLGLDFTRWLQAPRNEGLTRVGDTETVKITGEADVQRMLTDLEQLGSQAKALNLPGLGAGQLTPQQRQEAAAAIKALNVEVYTGAEDRMLRRLVVNGDVEDDGAGAKVLLDVTFTKVGEDQGITAPANPKPFSALLKAAGAVGLGDIAGLMGGAQPGKALAPNKVDEYSDCIAQAAGDRTQARKCASVLNGG